MGPDQSELPRSVRISRENLTFTFTHFIPALQSGPGRRQPSHPIHTHQSLGQCACKRCRVIGRDMVQPVPFDVFYIQKWLAVDSFEAARLALMRRHWVILMLAVRRRAGR